MDQVEKLCNEMPRSLSNDIASQWQSIMEDAKETVSGMLDNRLSSVEDMAYGNIHSERSSIEMRSLSFDEKIGNYRNQFYTGFFLTTIAVLVCPPLVIPKIITTALITGWSWLRGKKKNDELLLQQNKNNLTQQLGLMLDEINHQLLDVQPGNSRSRVNEFVYQLKRAAEKAISETVNNQKQQMRQQLSDMESQAMKSIEDKKLEQQVLGNALNSWQKLVPQTKELTDLYSQIEKCLTAE